MSRATALIALALAALGCGSTSTFHVITGTVGRPARNDPRVFLAGATLPSNYDEVAIVQAIGRGNQADLEHVIEGLRAEAASLGCDAVIGARSDHGDTQTSGTGVAVRWTAGPPPTASTSGSNTPSPWTPEPATVVAPWAAAPSPAPPAATAP